MIVLILMVIDFNSRLESLNRLKKQQVLVSAKATHAIQTQTALQTQVANAASDQIVHEWARAEAHLVQAGDQPVVPIGVPGATAAVLASPTPASTAMANWQIWWRLFFGE